MEKHWPVTIMVAAMATLALVAFAYYRWRQHLRTQGIKAWVMAYLRARFGESLERVTVKCSDDTHWPVLVSFDDVQTRTRHGLQFHCPRPPSSMRLKSERSELLTRPGERKPLDRLVAAASAEASVKCG